MRIWRVVLQFPVYRNGATWKTILFPSFVLVKGWYVGNLKQSLQIILRFYSLLSQPRVQHAVSLTLRVRSRVRQGKHLHSISKEARAPHPTPPGPAAVSEPGEQSLVTLGAVDTWFWGRNLRQASSDQSLQIHGLATQMCYTQLSYIYDNFTKSSQLLYQK